MRRIDKYFFIFFFSLGIISMVLGFVRIDVLFGFGSKNDLKRVSDIQSLAQSIKSFYEANNRLPGNTYEIDDRNKYKDPKTGVPYIYHKTNETGFSICATFQTDASRGAILTSPAMKRNVMPPINSNNVIYHTKGSQCFDYYVTPVIQRKLLQSGGVNVSNPDFEIWNGSAPTYWITSVSQSYKTTDAYNGVYAIRFPALVDKAYVSSNKFNVSKGVLNIGTWYNTADQTCETCGFLGLRLYDINQKPIIVNAGEKVCGEYNAELDTYVNYLPYISSKYRAYNITCTLPQDAAYASIVLGVDNSSDYTWTFDKISAYFTGTEAGTSIYDMSDDVVKF